MDLGLVILPTMSTIYANKLVLVPQINSNNIFLLITEGRKRQKKINKLQIDTIYKKYFYINSILEKFTNPQHQKQTQTDHKTH